VNTGMNRILFYMEMRRNARSLFLWSAVIGLLIFFTMSLFRTVLQYQQQIAGMVTLVPAMALKMRGFSSISDIFSVLGFYTANNLIYMMLLGSIYAIVLSSNILLKEEYGKTAEYLMSRPITRGEIFTTKLAIVFLNVIILNVLATMTGFISIMVYKKGPFTLQPFLVIHLYTSAQPPFRLTGDFHFGNDKTTPPCYIFLRWTGPRSLFSLLHLPNVGC